MQLLISMPLEILDHFQKFYTKKPTKKPCPASEESYIKRQENLIENEPKFQFFERIKPTKNLSRQMPMATSSVSRSETLLTIAKLQNVTNSPEGLSSKNLSQEKNRLSKSFTNSPSSGLWERFQSIKLGIYDYKGDIKKKRVIVVQKPPPNGKFAWHLFPHIGVENPWKALRIRTEVVEEEHEQDLNSGFWDNVVKEIQTRVPVLSKHGKAMKKKKISKELVNRPFLYNFGNIILEKAERSVNEQDFFGLLNVVLIGSKSEAEVKKKGNGVDKVKLDDGVVNYVGTVFSEFWQQIWFEKKEKTSKEKDKLKIKSSKGNYKLFGIWEYSAKQDKNVSLPSQERNIRNLDISFVTDRIGEIGFPWIVKPTGRAKQSDGNLFELNDGDLEMPSFTPYMAKIPWHGGPRAFLSKFFPRYGNYCGPNWSSGKESGDYLWDKRPVDLLDYCCYCHDVGYDTHDQTEMLKADIAFLDCLERIGTSKKKRLADVTEAYRSMCIAGVQNILIPYRSFLVQQIETKGRFQVEVDRH